MEERKKFRWDWEIITENKQNFRPVCADIFFSNQGSHDVLIRGFIRLSQGDTLALPAFGDEEFDDQFNITFDTSTGTTSQLLVGRKIYQREHE